MFIGVIIAVCKSANPNLPYDLKMRVTHLAANDRWQADHELKRIADDFAKALQHQTFNGVRSMEYALYPIEGNSVEQNTPISDLGRTWVQNIPSVEIEFVNDEDDDEEKEDDEWNS